MGLIGSREFDARDMPYYRNWNRDEMPVVHWSFVPESDRITELNAKNAILLVAKRKETDRLSDQLDDFDAGKGAVFTKLRDAEDKALDRVRHKMARLRATKGQEIFKLQDRLNKLGLESKQIFKVRAADSLELIKFCNAKEKKRDKVFWRFWRLGDVETEDEWLESSVRSSEIAELQFKIESLRVERNEEYKHFQRFNSIFKMGIDLPGIRHIKSEEIIRRRDAKTAQIRKYRDAVNAVRADWTERVSKPPDAVLDHIDRLRVEMYNLLQQNLDIVDLRFAQSKDIMAITEAKADEMIILGDEIAKLRITERDEITELEIEERCLITKFSKARSDARAKLQQQFTNLRDAEDDRVVIHPEPCQIDLILVVSRRRHSGVQLCTPAWWSCFCLGGWWKSGGSFMDAPEERVPDPEEYDGAMSKEEFLAYIRSLAPLARNAPTRQAFLHTGKMAADIEKYRDLQDAGSRPFNSMEAVTKDDFHTPVQPTEVGERPSWYPARTMPKSWENALRVARFGDGGGDPVPVVSETPIRTRTLPKNPVLRCESVFYSSALTVEVDYWRTKIVSCLADWLPGSPMIEIEVPEVDFEVWEDVPPPPPPVVLSKTLAEILAEMFVRIYCIHNYNTVKGNSELNYTCCTWRKEGRFRIFYAIFLCVLWRLN